MEIEIELKSAPLADDIYELRKYLEENIDGLRLEIKTQPAPEGQMLIEEVGIGILHGILEGVGKEGGKLIVESGKKVFRLIREWTIKKNKGENSNKDIQSLGPGVSVDNGKERVYITEDEKGSLHVYDNFNFAINANDTYALLVGVSEFESDFPPIPPIRNNLVDFYNLLVDKRHVGLPRKNVHVVFNKTDHEIA
ncbi:MAG TPA: hypothetical protein VI461_16885, partial [Chitinophagaceae bacterium]|nr:hypothetical protein [Chitinophagaceae bacterium]